MRNLKIVSVNVRGLGGQQKRRDVLHYLRNRDYDVVFLQDTHLTKNKIPFFDSLWKGKAYHSYYSNTSRGASILIDRGLQHKVLFEYVCERGNYMILGCRIGSQTYVLGSIYGPNRDEPAFYERIGELLGSVECENIILGGDFNFVIDSRKDSYGYIRENNVNARNKFASVCAQYRLVDVWREYNPEDQQFTWIRSNNSQGARLDMFFISEHLCNSCVDQKITPGYRTDHNIILIEIALGESPRGPGLWKFNESLLKDDAYIEIVEKCIESTVKQYALPVYTESFLVDPSNYKDIALQINDDLFYETLLMMIRGETVKFSKQKTRLTKEKEKEILQQIENAQFEHFQLKTEQSASRLQKYKDELEELRKPIIDGLIIRSRTAWHEEGERSSKYFLGLEKRNALRKSVVVLKSGEQILTQTSSILEAFTNSLATRYNKRHIMLPSVEEFISKNVSAVLSDKERSSLELPLSYEELTEVAQAIKKGKSPGSNGYTSAFFKRFWKLLGPFLYRAYIFCSRVNKMILTHREGIITMIPKAGKPPDDIKAWRPITLLNTDFKIISSAIAARLKRVLGNIVDECQTAYIKGRYIGENTRLVFDVIHNLTEGEKTGYIMSADFEAAFDSLSWDFVLKVMKCCNFGEQFRNLISSIYMNEDNFSRIMMNGYLGKKIFLSCGIRQGDPASGYLFNLAVNVLANQIKQSQELTGIRISDRQEVRIMQYADDTVLFLNGEASSVRGAITELDIFAKFSGLNLNIEKTSCLPVGFQGRQYHSDNIGCKWVENIKILGIAFSNDNSEIVQVNIKPKIEQIKREIVQWNRRNLSPLGKITVIKSLLLSKLIHLLTVLPSPSQTISKQLERIFFSFLWGGQRDPIKRARAVQNFAAGGLRMIDVNAFIRSLKLSWLKRLTESKAEWAKLVQQELPSIQRILQFGSRKLLKIRSRISNPFWQDVLEAYSRFSIDYNPGLPLVLTESLWYSDYSKFKCTIVEEWNRKGLRFLADLIDESTGQVMTREALKARFGISMTFLCYSSLLKSLPDCVKFQKANNVQKPIIPLRMNLVLNDRNFARFAYGISVECRKVEFVQSIEKQKQKWLRDVGYFDGGSFETVMKATHSTRYQFFHYKLVNRIITTNRFLKIINVRDDDKCTFCDQETETLAHVFWFCPDVQTFISEVSSYLQSQHQINLIFEPKTWFFLGGLTSIESLIVTIAKLVIYEARLAGGIPNIIHFSNKLRREAEVEITGARLRNNQKSFETKWGSLGRILQ